MLLIGYGVELEPRLLVGGGNAFSVVLTGQYPGIFSMHPPKTSGARGGVFDSLFQPFTQNDGFTMPFPSPLVVHAKKQPGASFREVATIAAPVVTTSPVELGPRDESAAAPGDAQRTVGVAVEGTIRSAYNAEVSTGNARILVLSSAQFLANPYLRAVPEKGTPGDSPEATDERQTLQSHAGTHVTVYMAGNMLAFVNSLDWLAREDLPLLCRRPVPNDD